jgi:homoserine dehydrogenase
VPIPAPRRAGGDEGDRIRESGAPSNLQLTRISDRRAGEKRALLRADGVACTSSIDEALQSGADAIVEAIGGVEPAADWIRTARLAGKSVVTANKQVVARQNAALITGAHSGEIGILGRGAGGDATAVALLGDIAAIATHRSAVVPALILTGHFRMQNLDFRLESPVLREAV